MHPNQNKSKTKGKNMKNRKKWQLFKPKPKQSVIEDQEIKTLQAKYSDINVKNITLFTDFPLSTKTIRGLKDNNYKTPTAIQRESIGYSLQGKDVLGAAITGSGKTLAFLVPVLENLFLKKWSRMDGVGAIIISPTRELSYQIFETLKKVGKYHDFSAGLIIGGKNLKFERSRMDQCNVIICTPGRLLQHMDENPLFNCSTMQILVLDEADRCLDMGFEQTMNAIIEHLPPDRQTLLFSATQTKSVKDLARLSLKDPVYVAPHEQAEHTTPQSLQQNYVVVALEDKITMLWSFIKNHLKQKIIVFLSSCKQVKYIYEIFCKLRPGTSVIALYGTLHQDRRMAIYNEFCRKSNVVLFATDIASRGLDFPIVNWVVQLDCPEDATAYIHRAGRTARHKAHGENLLVLLPSEEEAMVEELKERKVPINKIHIDPKKLFTPRAKMEAYLAQNQTLKESAQRAFVAYIKSVYLMKNKKIFNVNALDTDAFARSLGLVVAPRIRFLQRLKKSTQKREIKSEDESDNENDETEIVAKSKDNTKIEFNFSSEDEGDENDFIKVKRKDHEIGENDLSDVTPLDEERSKSKTKLLTKPALAKRVLKKKIQANQRTIFDEDGTEIVDSNRKLQSNLAKEYEEAENDGGIDIDKAKNLLREEDKFDKERFRQLVKARRREAKLKAKKDKAEQEVHDDFGSEDESDGPDLSWLPDPDQIYGNKADKHQREVVNSSDESSDSDGGSIEDEEIHRPAAKQISKSKIYGNESKKKQREVVNSSDESSASDSGSEEEEKIHRPPAKLISKSKKHKNDNVSDEEIEEPVSKKSKKLASKLSVDEAEMIAMRLLESG